MKSYPSYDPHRLHSNFEGFSMVCYSYASGLSGIIMGITTTNEQWNDAQKCHWPETILEGVCKPTKQAKAMSTDWFGLVAIFGYTHRADVTDIASIYSNVFWRQQLSSFIESLMDGCIYNYHRQHNTMMSRNSVLILIQKVKKCPGIQSLLFNLVHCLKQVLNYVRNYLFPTLIYIFNSTIAPRRA